MVGLRTSETRDLMELTDEVTVSSAIGDNYQQRAEALWRNGISRSSIKHIFLFIMRYALRFAVFH